MKLIGKMILTMIKDYINGERINNMPCFGCDNDNEITYGLMDLVTGKTHLFNDLSTAFSVVGDPVTFSATVKPMVVRPPKVKDVKSINDKVVIVTFTDGSRTKAVCNKEDKFDLEIGIGICIAKRMFSNDEKTANSAFNKAIKDAVKVMKRNEECEIALAELEEEEQRIEAKIRRKKEKRAEKRRQKRIQEMADAILLAETKKTEAKIIADKIAEMPNESIITSEELQRMIEDIKK